jgi:hypothetical protein
MNSYPWSNTVNDLINAYGSDTPLTITRANPGTYSATTLTTSGDASASTYYVMGAIVPASKKPGKYDQSEQATFNTGVATLQAYLKSTDTSGNIFAPAINDTITVSGQDFRAMEINKIQPDGVVCGYIIDLSV